jgi:hypothetical protein
MNWEELKLMDNDQLVLLMKEKVNALDKAWSAKPDDLSAREDLINDIDTITTLLQARMGVNFDD